MKNFKNFKTSHGENHLFFLRGLRAREPKVRCASVRVSYLVALIATLAVLLPGCSTDDGGQTLGTVQILVRGSPVGPGNQPSTGDTLYAQYSGQEEVSYQWQFGGANVGEDRYSFLAEEPGTYTVTVSYPGYQSSTSAPVTVGGQALPSLPGTLIITVNGAPVTAAQTGEELTAVYSGDEMVSYRWFKDGAALTQLSSPTDTACTPTESGSYTVTITASGYRARTSDPVTVTGASLITITFDLNDGSYDPPVKIVAPGAPIGTLPDAPPQDGYIFDGWYTEQSEGTKLTATSTFDEDTTVYARWSFSGLILENPAMEQGTGFTGTISDDGTISFTAGAFQYKFPTTVNGVSVNISEYAYFQVEYELTSASGSGSGVFLRQYGNSTTYGGVANQYPWLSNKIPSEWRFPVSGAGTTDGFSIGYNGGTTTIVVKITKITFYKLPQYTVTFDLDGGTGSAPSLEVWEGFTLSAQFPAAPTKTSYTFTGWKNAAGDVVTGTTPIMGNWTLTAQWALTAELGDEWIELVTTDATSAPVYGFDLPNGKTFGDYDRLVFKFKIDNGSPNKSGRIRAWGNYDLSAWTNVNSRPNMGNDGNFAAGGRLLNEAGENNYSTMTDWTAVTIEFGSRDKNADADAIKAASGVIAVAFGLIPAAGGTGQRSYFVKDIELSNTDGDDKVPALKPTDSQLWGGEGASAYVSQAGSGAVTRMILPYEDD